MGVHHAWGRTYKDLFLRWRTMQGYRQRYQNGFDGQGLWVEVEVEKEKGFSSKRDIEAYGIGRFVEDCKERVRKYAAIQTRQSQRLGYWMDWDDSYHTMSDENNYTIWHFLKRCHEKGWLYRGTDSMPWCARCGTGLSQHEIVTEGYQDVTHTAVYVRLPLTDLKGRAEGESLLIWTTTPWTLTANVAAAVHPEHRYVRARVGDEIIYLGRKRIDLLTEMSGESKARPEDAELVTGLEQLGVSDLLGVATAGEILGIGVEVLEELPGSALVGRTYRGPFDDLEAQHGVEHRVIPWNDVGEDEGTAIVHIAPGAGPEDFALGKEHGLAVVAPLDENGYYVDGFGWLTGNSVFDVRDRIFADLERQRAAVLHRGAPAPLSVLLALQQRTGVPGGRRVVHLHGRAAPHHDGDHPQGALDPGVRAGARARLAAQHARLDDLQEALLGPGAADLDLRCVRQLRGGRQRA